MNKTIFLKLKNTFFGLRARSKGWPKFFLPLNLEEQQERLIGISKRLLHSK